MTNEKQSALDAEDDRRWARMNDIERIVCLLKRSHIEYGMHVHDANIQPWFDACCYASDRLAAYLNERGIPLYAQDGC